MTREGLVLDPSETAGECSSVGMPRVVRYLSETGDRYVMWYQGRDKTIEPEVVPLSTGRIWKAESSDGITWKAALGADALGGAGGAAFGLADDWWGFDTAHVGLGDMLYSQSDQFKTDSGTYFCYYYGGTYEPEPLSAFAPASAAAATEDERTVVGMRMRIGVAVSQDGTSWARLEGEHPTGACLDVGDPGDFDGTFVGWPQVVPMPDRDSFRMYYHSLDRATGRYAVGAADSKDSLKFTKVGGGGAGGDTRGERGAAPVFEGGAPGAFDERGVARRHVLREAGAAREAGLAGMLPGGGGGEATWRMFYEGIGADGRHAIGLATSRDGLAWDRANGGAPVFEPATDPAAWDSRAVGSPHVMRISNGGGPGEPPGRLAMYYAGNAGTGGGAIGLAYSDDDGMTWQRARRELD